MENSNYVDPLTVGHFAILCLLCIDLVALITFDPAPDLQTKEIGKENWGFLA